MQKNIIVLLVLLSSLLGYIVAGPYMTISSIKEGIDELNPVKIARRINFRRLREDFKAQFRAQDASQIDPKKTVNPLHMAKNSYADHIIDDLIDTYVTPRGLKQLTDALKRMAKSETPKKESSFTAGFNKVTHKNVLPEGLHISYKTSFDALEKFSIEITSIFGESEFKTKVRLEREGLSWEVVAITLPFEPIPP